MSNPSTFYWQPIDHSIDKGIGRRAPHTRINYALLIRSGSLVATQKRKL